MGEVRVKRVGFWNRMSHQNSVDNESHINHRMRAEEFCKFHGYQLVKEYSLMDVPGSKIREHQAYWEYRADVRAGKIDALLVTWIKRFARKVSILVEEVQFLQDQKVDFIAINDNVDTTTPYGRFFFHLISALAELESDEVSERIRQSIKPRAERGMPLGGKAPFGYQWAARRLAVNLAEADIVRKAFINFIRIRNLSPTCGHLNAEGVQATKGRFTCTTLRRILTNTAYVGRHLRNYRGFDRSGKIYWKDQKDHVFTECPRIIDQETWETAQGILQQIRTNQPPKALQHNYLLSGLLVCDCGGKLYGATYRDEKWSKYVCKECQKRLRMDKVDSAILELLETVILRSDYLEDRIRSIGPVKADYIPKARTIRSMLHKCESRDKNLLLKTLIKTIKVDGEHSENLNVHFRLLPAVHVPQTVDRTGTPSGESSHFYKSPIIQVFPGKPEDAIEFVHTVSLKDPPLPENTLAQRILKARKEAGLYQSEIDRRAGLALGSCGRFEIERNVPTRTSLVKLAKALGASVDWLVNGSTF